MLAIPFVSLDEPQYGELVAVAPGIGRIVARNPSKFTYRGTGTYVVGADIASGSGVRPFGDRVRGDVVVIDPGPRLDDHRAALERALAECTVRAVLVTHCHADHSPLASWLSAETGAPTIGFGPHPRPTDAELQMVVDDTIDEPDPEDALEGQAIDADPTADSVPERIEESTDHDFVPDIVVRDGEIAALLDGVTLRAVHTPGHTSNHLCFAFEERSALFTGDHVMGWSTTVIGPPDGDMRAYLESLRRVRDRRDGTLWPTHGAPITDPGPFLDAFLAHRLDREAQVLDAVRRGETTVAEMVRSLYAGVRRGLHAPARRSVLAHLIKLADDGLVVCDAERPSLRSVYRPS
jgi:glyoxylase-like metal-dependent hydrolase (beta-lactamase superfamily II)